MYFCCWSFYDISFIFFPLLFPFFKFFGFTAASTTPPLDAGETTTWKFSFEQQLLGMGYGEQDEEAWKNLFHLFFTSLPIFFIFYYSNGFSSLSLRFPTRHSEFVIFWRSQQNESYTHRTNLGLHSLTRVFLFFLRCLRRYILLLFRNFSHFSSLCCRDSLRCRQHLQSLWDARLRWVAWQRRGEQQRKERRRVEKNYAFKFTSLANTLPRFQRRRRRRKKPFLSFFFSLSFCVLLLWFKLRNSRNSSWLGQ